MNEPHVEVFSRNRVSRSQISFVAVTIPVLALTGLGIYALLPFLWLIGYGMMALAAISFLYLVALLAIDIRRRWIEASFIHLSEHGVVDTQQGRMWPLLPAPVQVSEVKDSTVDRIKQALDILELHKHGSGIRTIAKSYADNGDSYWSEWRVRQVIEGHKNA
jgi:hypothetical protein